MFLDDEIENSLNGKSNYDEVDEEISKIISLDNEEDEYEYSDVLNEEIQKNLLKYQKVKESIKIAKFNEKKEKEEIEKAKIVERVMKPYNDEIEEPEVIKKVVKEKEEEEEEEKILVVIKGDNEEYKFNLKLVYLFLIKRLQKLKKFLIFYQKQKILKHQKLF
jgi:hypothetical protein